MKYDTICYGIFRERPNRFIAHVEIDGIPQICHVKNTGRCRELLVPGAKVVLQKAANPARRTAYDLIAVWKGDLLINLDAQAPNAVFSEWARRTGFPEGLRLLKAEQTYGDSRFDFYFETDRDRGYIEVKGVTLEKDGVARFPDAPTARGTKHLRGLTACAEEGLQACAVFVAQMPGMRYLEPNDATDPDFGKALRDAQKSGVRIVALECRVQPDSLEITGEIPIRLTRE